MVDKLLSCWLLLFWTILPVLAVFKLIPSIKQGKLPEVCGSDFDDRESSKYIVGPMKS